MCGIFFIVISLSVTHGDILNLDENNHQVKQIANCIVEISSFRKYSKRTVVLYEAVTVHFLFDIFKREIADLFVDRQLPFIVTNDLNKVYEVPVLYGAIVEGIATCLCRLASRSLGDLNPRVSTAIDSFIGTSLVVAGVLFRNTVLTYRYEDSSSKADLSVSVFRKIRVGKAFDYSGRYFNPVLATSLKAGCEGHTLAEHALVYWLGTCAGSVISVYLYKLPAIQKFVKGTTEVNGDSIWADKDD